MRQLRGETHQALSTIEPAMRCVARVPLPRTQSAARDDAVTHAKDNLLTRVRPAREVLVALLLTGTAPNTGLLRFDDSVHAGKTQATAHGPLCPIRHRCG